MRVIMNRFTALAFLLTVCFISVCAAPSFTVNAPGRVAAGSKFAVTFRLRDAQGTSLKAPQINGCTLLYGPSTSTSQSYSVINGQMTSSSTIDYTYYYRADKEGTYTIGEATIVADGKHLSTRPTQIVIGPASAGNGGAGASSGSSQQVDIDDITSQSADRNVSSNDVFC